MTTPLDELNEVAKKVIQKDDKGKFIISDITKVPSHLLLGVKKEAQRRNTESYATRLNQKIKQEEAKTKALQELLSKKVTPNLSTVQQEELDKLLYEQDYDKWKKLSAEYEQANIKQQKKELDEELKSIETKAIESTKLDTRQQAVEQLNSKLNTKYEVNEIVKLLPPILFDNLESGTITNEEFINATSAMLKGGTPNTLTPPLVIDTSSMPDSNIQPNITVDDYSNTVI